jgi:hypothetical protein
MISSDGITWTGGSLSTLDTITSVTYGNGVFVSVSTNGHVRTSYDGSRWILRSNPNSNQYRSITYGNGTFVAVSSTGTGNRVMTSGISETTTSTHQS